MFFLTLTAVLAAAPTTAFADSPVGFTPKPAEVISVQLPAPVIASELIKIADAVGARLMEIRRVFVIGEREVTVGVPAGTHGQFPDHLDAIMLQALDGLLGENGIEQDGTTAKLIAAAAATVRAEGPGFDRFDLVGPVDLTALPSYARVIPPVVPRAGSEVPQQLLAGPYIPALVSNHSYGDSIGRYNTLKFRWSSTNLNNLKTSGSGTFEPDVVTYNYDGYHYFGDYIVSWSSTMPNAYLDTSILDDPNERVYTIGTQTVSSLAANTTYSTFFRAGFGNTSSDTAKFVWQRGTYAWGCIFGPALCIFADQSVIQYAWFPIPGMFTGIV